LLALAYVFGDTLLLDPMVPLGKGIASPLVTGNQRGCGLVRDVT